MMLGCLFVVSVPSFAADISVTGDAVAGKGIFSKVCAYCHAIDGRNKLGPSLTAVGERRSVVWLSEWLKNPAEMIKKDVDAKVVRGNSKYNMTMPALPDMQNDQKRADVIAYLLRDF